MVRAFCLAIALALCVNSAAPAQTPITWKFKQGDTFYLEEATTVKVAVRVGLEDFKQTDTITALHKITVLSVTPEGNVVLQQTVEDVKSSGDAFTAQVIERMKGATFKLTLSPQMEILRWEGYDDFVRRLSGGDALVEQAIRTEMTADEVRQRLAEPLNLYLPGRAVRKGDTWTKQRDVKAAPLGFLSMTLKFSAAGEEVVDGRPLQKLAFTMDVKHTPGKGASGGLAILKSKLRFEGARGTVLFDSASGRLVRVDMHVPVEGTLTIAGGDETVDAHLTLEMTQTVRILDRRPWLCGCA